MYNPLFYRVFTESFLLASTELSINSLFQIQYLESTQKPNTILMNRHNMNSQSKCHWCSTTIHRVLGAIQFHGIYGLTFERRGKARGLFQNHLLMSVSRLETNSIFD